MNTLSGTIKDAVNGSRGFDVNKPLTQAQASLFKADGYDFCIRYLPRTSSLLKGNLTYAEAQGILNAGLAIGTVQHVAEPNWVASVDLGNQYGAFAGMYAKEVVGLPTGMNIWLDLEEVASGSDVKGYCKAWFGAILAAGFTPGIYVGYGVQLTDAELYALPFQHYWAAYNTDNQIPKRGYQMVQRTQETLHNITFDPNVAKTDLLGDNSLFLSL